MVNELLYIGTLIGLKYPNPFCMVSTAKTHFKILRRVWRYQRGNQNPYIEEQTTQWPKEKVQKDLSLPEIKEL